MGSSINTLLASSEFFSSADDVCMLDLNQALYNVVPDLDPNCLTLKYLFEKVNFEKCQQTTKKHEKKTACKEFI